jgi:hypothetical protein
MNRGCSLFTQGMISSGIQGGNSSDRPHDIIIDCCPSPSTKPTSERLGGMKLHTEYAPSRGDGAGVVGETGLPPKGQHARPLPVEGIVGIDWALLTSVVLLSRP